VKWGGYSAGQLKTFIGFTEAAWILEPTFQQWRRNFDRYDRALTIAINIKTVYLQNIINSIMVVCIAFG